MAKLPISTLWQTIKELGNLTQEVVFPMQCFVCGQEEHWWCRLDEPSPWPLCFFCRKPDHGERALGACRRSLPLVFLGHYDQPLLRLAIYEWKYRGSWAISRDWAKILSNQLEKHSSGENLLVPIPLHWRRHWERGYNQTEILAQQMEEYGHNQMTKLLTRKRFTPAQVSLSDDERRHNPIGSFQVTKAKDNNQPLWLVDDVVTTGTTIREAIRTLHKGGWRVDGVIALAVARSTEDSPPNSFQ